MSDNEATAASTADAKSGMPQGDVDFLIACLKNTTGGSISIDTKAVAEALGYTNHRSVGNRIAGLKKKYNLPFGGSVAGKGDGTGTTPSSTAKSKKASDTAGPNEPAIAATPSKNKVIKKRAPAAKKSPKTPTAHKKLSSKKATKGESEEEPDGEDQELNDSMAVKTPEKEDEELVTDDERIFGKKESGDEA